MGQTVVQTGSIYNVFGLIEKDKNIYYVPSQEKLYDRRTDSIFKVCDVYKKLFEEVCPPSSLYTDMELSRWNPEDRKLRVEGIADNFRKGSAGGLNLNYLVIRRTITTTREGQPDEVLSYLVGFFITSVKQAGINSVDLMLEPDYFTNAFYWSCYSNLGADYNPFESLVNTMVERQHYDRVRYSNAFDNELFRPINFDKILSDLNTYKYKYQYIKDRVPLFLTDIKTDEWFKIISDIKQITKKSNFRTYLEGLPLNYKKAVINLFLAFINIQFKNDITPTLALAVFDGEEVTQYTSKITNSLLTKGYNIASPLMTYTIPFIMIPQGFENIKSEWFDIYTGVNYLNANLTVKRTSSAPALITAWLSAYGAGQYIHNMYVTKYNPIYNYMDIRTDSQELGIVVIFNTYIDNERYDTNENRVINQPYLQNRPSLTFLPPMNINQDRMIYVIPKICILGADSTESFFNYRVQSNLLSVSNATATAGYYESNRYVVTPQSQTCKQILENLALIGIPRTEINEFKLEIKEDIKSPIYNNYEPILECEPYKFYSIGINEVEQPISKMKYFRTLDYDLYYLVILRPIMSLSDNFKISLIPYYNVSTDYYDYLSDYKPYFKPYYLEAISTIESSQIPILSDSYFNYYLTNKAQMKSQYAINDIQLGQQTATGAVGLVGDTISALTLGGLVGRDAGVAYGIKSGGRGVTGMINSLINHGFNQDIIKTKQNAVLTDMGARANNVKQSASDLLYELQKNEMGYYLNLYDIDEVSKNSISKVLERTGYHVDLMDSINAFNRIGFNYVKLTSLDFNDENIYDIRLSSEQEEAIRNIFLEGVTLLHNPEFLHNLGELHNYERSLTPFKDNVVKLEKDIDLNMLNQGYESAIRRIHQSSLLSNCNIQTSYANGIIWRVRDRNTDEIISSQNIGRIAITGNASAGQGTIEVYTWVTGSTYRKVHETPITPEEYNSGDTYWSFELINPAEDKYYPSKPDVSVLTDEFSYLIIKGGDY